MFTLHGFASVSSLIVVRHSIESNANLFLLCWLYECSFSSAHCTLEINYLFYFSIWPKIGFDRDCRFVICLPLWNRFCVFAPDKVACVCVCCLRFSDVVRAKKMCSGFMLYDSIVDWMLLDNHDIDLNVGSICRSQSFNTIAHTDKPEKSINQFHFHRSLSLLSL